MKKMFVASICFLCSLVLVAQPIEQKIAKAYAKFVADPQLRSGISSLYVIDATSGKVVFNSNGHIGLATASTLKVITAASAYEFLGQDYRYTTQFYLGKSAEMTDSEKDQVRIMLVKGSGDPTLGSWRWKETTEDEVLKRIRLAFKATGEKYVHDVRVNTEGWSIQTVPGGWTYQDMGNYFGAGASGLNWRENQYDLILKSKGKKLGDYAEYIGTKPYLHGISLESHVRVAPKGTGDRVNIYYSTHRSTGIGFPVHAVGTIPADSDRFTVSGSFPSGEKQFQSVLWRMMTDSQLVKPVSVYSNASMLPLEKVTLKLFHTEFSPSMDSIIYWFLRKSVNLYGEALIKTIALKTSGIADTDSGTAIVKNFWKQKNIDPVELNMIDGSGLSPENRVTTRAQVAVLHYARTQSWYKAFFNSFPEYNNMKMKSGTISGVKGFTGYHRSSNGKEYIFSFIVNNYNGSHDAVVGKMYKVLDGLK